MKMLGSSLLFFLFLPAVALAAGFAPSPLFLSRSPVTVGATVRIYAVLENEETVAFSGQAVFREGTSTINKVSVSLAAGATQTVSTLWTPTAGTHNVSVDLDDQSGTVVQTQSATFQVQSPAQSQSNPSPTSGTSGSFESSQSIQNSIGSVSPQVESVVAPAFNFVDGVRQAAANGLSSQLTTAQSQVAGSQPSSTTSVGGISVPDTTNSFFWVLWTAYFYLLTVLLFLINNAAVFYPVVALIFLWFLWMMFRRFRRA